MIIHCGDICGDENYLFHAVECPIHLVAGNCDIHNGFPRGEEFMIRDKKVFITHGHYEWVNFGHEKLHDLIKEKGYDIICYGHTHKQVLEHYGGSYIVNPGSLSLPRDGRKGKYVILEFDQHGTPFFALNEM